ncbi:TadE/TadG family type IV pilus assembly protein [Methylobacterium nonmethylotrophicum]|nr:TadE/TadG family type IV pilus assembly protein [Methylobacterium nonmethylotrophicum]
MVPSRMRAAETAPGPPWRRIVAFPSDRGAVAALEFALVFPFLVALTGGAFEYARFIRQARLIAEAASGVAGIIAMNVSSSIASADLHYANDAVMLIFPQVLADAALRKVAWNSDILISMAGISFSPTVAGCTASCTYKAKVAWTGGDKQRACGASLAAALDTANPDPATLPASLFTPVANPQGTSSPPSFVIVADLSFNWTPFLFSTLFKTVTIRRSAYIKPRYTNAIAYAAASGDDGFGQQCP